MNIALLTDSLKMPNIALMKLSTYHKRMGDTVSLFEPIFAHEYDKIYYSKIFTFTPIDLYVNGNKTEKGGTGFDIEKKLPDDIDNLPCDYSLYSCDYAVGFLTRGCIRNCKWCVVPKKEGNIYPYNKIEEIARYDVDKLILFDNNVLASDYGISEIERLINSRFKIDFNQGLDARLITQEVATILSKIKWIDYIRVSCDTSAMLPYIEKAFDNLKSAGYTKKIFCYTLAKDFKESYDRILRLDKMGDIHTFVQPYRDFVDNSEPITLLKELARWTNRKWLFKSCSFEDYLIKKNRRYLLDE